MPLGDQDYDTVQATGQTVTLSGGETYENMIVDLSTGQEFTINCAGSCTIRNVGFSGTYSGQDFLFTITAPSGANVLLENIYMGDGGTKQGVSFTHGNGGVFYHIDSSCDVTFRYCNVQGFPNNGFYCSNTASGGTATWENCFAKNNGVTSYRCADSGDRLENCVAYNDNTDYGSSYSTGWVESNGRPLWVWDPGGCTLNNCNFAAGTYSTAMVIDGAAPSMSGGAYSGGTQGSVNESNVGSDPDLSPPEGVPMTAEQAATGGSGDGQGGGGAPSDPPEQDYDTPYPGEWNDPGTIGEGSQPTPPQDPDRSADVTGVRASGATTVRDSDFRWAGDGAVTRTNGGTIEIYNSRFSGDDATGDGIDIIELDSGQPDTSVPEAAPSTGPGAVDDASGYPTTIEYRVTDVYLSDIIGPALHVGASSLSADIVVENVHIDGADYGIIADGVDVIVQDCEVVADVPFGSINGGSIDHTNTNTGENANPTPPDNVPIDPEDAFGGSI